MPNRDGARPEGQPERSGRTGRPSAPPVAGLAPDSMPSVWLHLATAADHPVAERLWLMFRHDLSEFGGQLPGPDGTFRSERLQAAFTNPDWAAYLLMDADRPIGLAVVRGLAGEVRVLTAFFVVRGARRAGVGLRAVVDLVSRHPGRWEVAFQDNNAAAVSFWRRAATEIAADAWTEEHRPVPGQPDVPPDAWISFRAAGHDSGAR